MFCFVARLWTDGSAHIDLEFVFFFFFISIFVVDGLTLDLPTGYDLFLLSPLKNSTAIITTEAFKKTSPLSPSDGWRERDSRCINALTLQLFPSSILYYFLFFP